MKTNDKSKHLYDRGYMLICGNMPKIFLELSEEEKKELDIAKAKSDYNTWRDFFLGLMEDGDNNEIKE